MTTTALPTAPVAPAQLLQEQTSWQAILTSLKELAYGQADDYALDAALQYHASTAMLFEHSQALGLPRCTLGNVVAAVTLVNPRELLLAIATNTRARNFALPLINCLEVGAIKQLNSIVEIARRLVAPLMQEVPLATQLAVAGHFKTTPFDIRQGIEEKLDPSKRYDFFAAAGLNYVTAVGLLIEEGETRGYPSCTPRAVAAAVKLIEPAHLLPFIAGNSSARAVVAPLIYSFQSAAAGATEQLNGIVMAARELVGPLLSGCELEAQQQVVQQLIALLNASS